MAETKQLVQTMLSALQAAVSEAFQVQFSAKAEAEKFYMNGQGKPHHVEVMSTLSLSSSSFIGYLNLCFPKDTFLKAVNQLLGENYTVVDSQNADAACEILNIIYGITKQKVNETGYDFAPSLPTSIFGDRVSVSQSAHACLYVDFKSDFGPFHMILGLKRVQQAAS